MYALGSAQSHWVITTLRSIPCGRRGAGGTSPAAMRSVQSANICDRALMPEPPDVGEHSARRPVPTAPAAPTAPCVVGSVLNIAGISRVPLVPSWWHAVHVPDLIVRRKSACVFTFGEMPLPSGPVPGNSDFAGTWSSEYQ